MAVAGGLAKEVYETQQMLLLCDIWHSRKLVWNVTTMLCSQRLWAEWRTSRSLIPPPAPWRCAGNRRRATSGSTASSTCPRPEAPRTWLEITLTSCPVMCHKGKLGISSDRQSRFTSAHQMPFSAYQELCMFCTRGPASFSPKSNFPVSVDDYCRISARMILLRSATSAFFWLTAVFLCTNRSRCPAAPPTPS